MKLRLSLIWIVTAGVGFISHFNPHFTIIALILIITIMLVIETRTQEKLKEQIAKQTIKHFHSDDFTLNQLKTLFGLPILSLILVIVLVIGFELGTKEWVLFLCVTPISPSIFVWIRKLVFEKYAYGALISSDYIKLGFDGRKIKYSSIKSIDQEANEFRINTKDNQDYKFEIEPIELDDFLLTLETVISKKISKN